MESSKSKMRAAVAAFLCLLLQQGVEAFSPACRHWRRAVVLAPCARTKRSTSLRDFQLANLRLPLQSDPSRYIELLHEVIPEDKLLRWYIVGVENGECIVDAVYSPEELHPTVPLRPAVAAVAAPPPRQRT